MSSKTPLGRSDMDMLGLSPVLKSVRVLHRLSQNENRSPRAHLSVDVDEYCGHTA